MKKIAIFGIGGFAKELADLAIDQGYTEICFLARNVQNQQMLLGFPVIDESMLSDLDNTDFAIGITDPKVRQKIYISYPHLHFPNLVHSHASLGFGIRETLKNSKGVVIAAGARITNSCSFGDFIILSFNCTIGHDCKLDSYVSVMPGVNLSGCVHVGTCVYIGTNAAILPGKSPQELKTLNEYTTIGAGAVVLKNTLAHTTYIGAPAKELKRND
ncbi:PglD-related sugar-binding protein [Acinetobacter faecalis]|uniref:PglD-related sugar-binding protein n=1 Tax=Acinetobacter faecalis TaxID=2665161 RepID=UPI002A9188D7|nr:sugar O-acyltransferase [Acinetobacter faecalis]MDY6531277.1 sugar O-acyltransferase [Acinetobacter faecalis]